MDSIDISWKPLFDRYQIDLDELYSNNKVFPPRDQIFRVFSMDVSDIKILLLGQDPYHGEGQAHGLSFSVPNKIKIPPSLKNIFKEINLEFPDRNYKFESGNLEQWFYREKIFLLNASLSVELGKPLSHIDIWDEFTNSVIKFISKKNKNCIYVLLGNYAKTKSQYIKNKSKIITGIHPSPLAHGFIGSNIFIQIEEMAGKQINWSI